VHGFIAKYALFPVILKMLFEYDSRSTFILGVTIRIIKIEC